MQSNSFVKVFSLTLSIFYFSASNFNSLSYKFIKNLIISVFLKN